MRVAVIDCGTNTFNLIIIEWHGGAAYRKIYSSRIAVKLGEGAINEGYIAEASFRRGLDALQTFRATFDTYRVDKIQAFATSAIRDARNGADFVREALAHYQIPVTVIDGNREAELIYFGIREAVRLGEQVSLIMDIGGGSNEFLLANRHQIFWKQSFNIGAARVLEKFRHSNPITQAEEREITHYLEQALQPLLEAAREFRPSELIGSSGAFESLVEMIHGELGGEPLSADKTEYEVNLDQHFRISGLVKSLSLEERRRIKGLLPIRFDMIVISCMMVDLVLNLLDLKRMRVSTYSLKEGALAEYLHRLSDETE
jgi:exopolyphosphatase/guanosine-5'-triphosphate,3'-diphosphate pyrophosphatase